MYIYIYIYIYIHIYVYTHIFSTNGVTADYIFLTGAPDAPGHRAAPEALRAPGQAPAGDYSLLVFIIITIITTITIIITSNYYY